MISWIIYAIIVYLVFFVLRFLWRAYTHPANILGRQAANMNWYWKGRIAGAGGFMDACYERDGMEAIVSYAAGKVFLLKPAHSTPFKDFIELERWLAQEKNISAVGVKQVITSKHLKAAFEVLDEAETIFRAENFKIIRDVIEKIIVDNSDSLELISKANRNWTPHEYVYAQIVNVAGDMLKSGQYHIYRGVLNPMGPGNDLLKIFNMSFNEMVRMRLVDKDYAKEQKAILKAEMDIVG
ncbi:MAG: hypothetical protein APR62_05540 [Smithella sp. SDB]|nr:MAG: hypothetical protein APR62_05540 [Smithella sp. SDB]